MTASARVAPERAAIADPEAAGSPASDKIDPLSTIESSLTALVRSLNRTRTHELLLSRAGVDVDRAGLALLYKLHLEGQGLRLTDLAERLQIDAPAVTRKVQQLERAGLISRVPDEDDRRATRLELTVSGRDIIDKVMAVRRAWLTELLEDWPESRRLDFARLLARFCTGVIDHLEEPHV